MRLLRPWTRLNARHPWSHNDAYGWWITRQARRLGTVRPRRALDVGCGTGNLLARLPGVVDEVTGLEPDSATAAIALGRFAESPTVRVVEGSFDQRPPGSWDLVTLVAVLHHLPLEETLSSLRIMIKPGGRLVVVGLSRETRADGPWSALSVLLNPLVGLLLHPRADGREPVGMTAPARDPKETLEEIKQVADRVLPGARIRRGLFFRYTLVWGP
ncbi:class I SAM-dependent methyltransferase [Microlunatus elymi]|uniref:Class I SAM-dependent methyltransferase n=1 Tax=Microlunatus elymi TaxID=2596828 RepID=A0A516Q6C7_9ACTN|nr:class I SAM-dependent methyltransferase [Microlunatus elymi]